MAGSIQFSRSVMSDSLWPDEPQNARPPCLSPTPEVYPNSCPLSQWCHPTISSSVVPFPSCLQFYPASRSFQMNQLFTSGVQSIGVSASTSVLPMNIQDWFPFRLKFALSSMTLLWQSQLTTNLSANFLALPPKYIQNANTGLHPPCHMGANHQLYPRWLQ